MIISLIVAAAENGVIGKDNKLPWNLPDDLKHFKDLTKGHTIIMGRKTFESIGRVLPDRRNIILSSKMKTAPEGAEVASDMDRLLNSLSSQLPEDEEVFVIGGSDLFTQWLEDAFTPIVCGRVHLTRVHADIEGDASFPDLDDDRWIISAREEHPADARHEHAFTFLTYDRA